MTRYGRVYRLDELDEGERFELRQDGLTFYGRVTEQAAESTYVEWETPGDGPDIVGWPHRTLVRKA